MTPRVGVLVLGRGHISHIVKMHSSQLPGIDQTNQECSNDDHGGFTKIVNFMIPRAGVLLVLGCDCTKGVPKL